MENIEKACIKSKRNPKTVRILGATKDVSIPKIVEAYSAGIRLFGENRVQEAINKIQNLKELDIEWHMIGNLQKNKIKKVLDNFHLIESISSWELAEEVNKEAQKRRIHVPCFLEVNLGMEESKWGFFENDLLENFEKLVNLKNLNIFGLMGIPPFSSDPEDSRKYFAKLRELGEKINSLKTDILIRELSMGMSNDYKVAVEEGATILRIGTAIFGERKR